MMRLLKRFGRLRFLGHRYLAITTVCFVVAGVWAGVSLLYFQLKTPFTSVAELYARLGLFVVLVLYLNHHRTTWVQTIVHPVLRYLVKAIVLFLQGLLIYPAGEIVAQFIKFWRHDALPLDRDFPYIIGLIVAPILISQVVPYLYYQGVKYFSVLRLFRFKRQGMGAQMEWASLGNIHDKKMRYTWFSGGRTDQIIFGSSTWAYDPKVRYVGDGSDSNLITLGAIGSGKTSTAVSTVLATYIGSVVVLDFKGEHCRNTYRRRNETNWRFKGRAISLDPFGVNDHLNIPINGYNLLSEIDPNGIETGLILAIAEACVVEEKSDHNIHFVENARSLVAGLIVHVITTFPKEKQTLPTVLDCLYGIDDQVGVSVHGKFNDLLIDMSVNPAYGGLAIQAAQDLLSMGDKERGGVMSTTARSLKWIGHPKMRAHLSRPSDFRFSDIGVDGYSTTVYIVLPFDKMQSQKRWLRVISSIGIAVQRERIARPKVPTLFVLDEFPQLGRFDAVLNSYAACREAGIRMWLLAQNWSQISAIYGENAHTFLANGTKQFFGVADIETAKMISDGLGKAQVNGVERDLLPPAEILSVLSKESNRQIVMMVKETGGRVNLPYYLERITYKYYRSDFRHHFGHARYYGLGSPWVELAKSLVPKWVSRLIKKLKIAKERTVNPTHRTVTKPKPDFINPNRMDIYDYPN